MEQYTNICQNHKRTVRATKVKKGQNIILRAVSEPGNTNEGCKAI